MGYVWTVYPRTGDVAMLATGITSDPAKARACVEAAIGSADGPAWGSVLSLGGTALVCSADDDGGLTWGSLFPDAGPVPGAPVSDAEMFRRASDLAALVRGWGHCYKITRDGDWWVAERRDNGAKARQVSADMLRLEIEDDHTENPVPEQHRLPEAS